MKRLDEGGVALERVAALELEDHRLEPAPRVCYEEVVRTAISSRSYQPSGCSVLLSAGILRASFRESLSEPAPLVPGETYVLDVELSDVGHVARPGHRLRLTVTSGLFPYYHPNPNTGEPYGAETRRVVAIQTIRHGGDHPSALSLFVRGGEPA